MLTIDAADNGFIVTFPSGKRELYLEGQERMLLADVTTLVCAAFASKVEEPPEQLQPASPAPEPGWTLQGAANG